MKKTILIFGPYLPGKAYGGPVKSLLNIVEVLNEHYNFHVITNDRDLHSEEAYTDVKIGSWNSVGKAKVFYLPKEKEIKYLISLLRETNFDLIYLSSYFSKKSVIVQCLKWLKYIKQPIIVAPRGEFSQGALSIKSLKKRLFISMYKLINIHGKVTFTCTSTSDRQDIINIFGSKVKVIMAGNIVKSEIREPNCMRNKVMGQLKIATVSRISRIKNIKYSIQLLKEIGDKENSFEKITFDIYGPLEDKEYWNECLSVISGLSGNISINYKGPVDYAEVTEVLSKYHIFLFPTKGENFGHVIQEAFLSGAPVIISDQTPWRELEKLEVGYDYSLADKDNFIEALKYYLYMDNNNYKLASRKAYEYGIYRVEQQLSIKEHLDMFKGEIKI